MARSRKPFTFEDLWSLDRLGAPSLSSDGAQLVASATRWDLATNRSRSTLWLMSTLGGEPRALTRCGDKDGQPRFAPGRHDIGFIAQREQEGAKDATPQFYTVPADGGEARRVGQVPTGVEAFRWCPDGRQVILLSWVFTDADLLAQQVGPEAAKTLPQAKGRRRNGKRLDTRLHGQEGQAAAMKAWNDRQATGLATDEPLHRYWDHVIHPGRVPHLLLMDVVTGQWRDLFEGSDFELTRTDPGAGDFDISPDGRRIAFAFDPAADKAIDGRLAIAELDLRKGRFSTAAQDAGWSLGRPRYSPDGQRLAFTASHQALKHTMPDQLAVCVPGEPFEVVSAEWDHEVQGPLHWEDDGSAVLLAAESQGRRHLWRFDLADRRAEVVAQGGWIQGFDKAAGTLVALRDAADHPGRLLAWLPGVAQPVRTESFNDAILARTHIRPAEAIAVQGALGDPVQLWLHLPPDFDPKAAPKRRWPVMHLIHGGPHTAMGDAWHYRWCAPLFAAQGYVVAIVNYHGSTGFGQAFADSITHRWGELELQDIEAATDHLLAQPWVDPARIYATGGSYGGFMVAWMNGSLPADRSRYAAYVCHAGCFDWRAMFADDAWRWHAKELGAWYWEDAARVERQSPVAQVANMATPTLVIHGAKDYRVPDAQGLAYYNSLKAKGVAARLLWFPDENHWVLKPANSRAWYAEFVAWMAAHALPKNRLKALKAARAAPPVKARRAVKADRP